MVSINFVTFTFCKLLFRHHSIENVAGIPYQLPDEKYLITIFKICPFFVLPVNFSGHDSTANSSKRQCNFFLVHSVYIQKHWLAHVSGRYDICVDCRESFVSWGFITVRLWYFCRLPSVHLSNACTLTKRNNILLSFLYRIKDPFISFSHIRMDCWGRPLVLLLLLHDLYSANFEDRIRGAGVARWRTWLTGEGEKVGF